MAEYGSTRFSDVARSTHAADPPRQARNLDRRNANPLLDAARETSASLWGAGPPRPSTPVDAAIDAVARPGLFDPMKNRNRLREFIDRGQAQKPSAPERRQSKREQLVERFRTAYPEPEDRDRFRWSAAFAALPDDQQRRVEAALSSLDEEDQFGFEVAAEYAEQLDEDNIPTAQILSELGYDVGGYDGGYDEGWAA